MVAAAARYHAGNKAAGLPPVCARRTAGAAVGAVSIAAQLLERQPPAEPSHSQLMLPAHRHQAC